MAKHTPKVTQTKTVHTFDTEAKRESLALPYHLVPTIALDRLAARFALGEAKYGTNNWTLGLPDDDVYNHVIAHLQKYAEGKWWGTPSNDDDLAAAMWGLSVLMHQETK